MIWIMQVLAQLKAKTDSAGNSLLAVTDFTPGDAGTISITNTPLLTMNADTRIETSTGWNGNAGAVVANVGWLFLKRRRGDSQHQRHRASERGTERWAPATPEA